jgi:hypothetical protein
VAILAAVVEDVTLSRYITTFQNRQDARFALAALTPCRFDLRHLNAAVITAPFL